MTNKEINDMKRRHNAAQDEGRLAYARVLELHALCTDLQTQLREAEGDDYDAIPLIFGGGFWVDEGIA